VNSGTAVDDGVAENDQFGTKSPAETARLLPRIVVRALDALSTHDLI
jgi:hypothetical protein